MADSLPAPRDIDLMRKELETVSAELAVVNENVKEVGRGVETVDRKVDCSDPAQLRALATALSAGTEVRHSNAEIAVLGKSGRAVRLQLAAGPGSGANGQTSKVSR
jgi:hypothetical protein